MTTIELSDSDSEPSVLTPASTPARRALPAPVRPFAPLGPTAANAAANAPKPAASKTALKKDVPAKTPNKTATATKTAASSKKNEKNATNQPSLFDFCFKPNPASF